MYRLCLLAAGLFVLTAPSSSHGRHLPPAEVELVDCLGRSDHVLLVEELDRVTEDAELPPSPPFPATPVRREVHRLRVLEVVSGDAALAGQEISVVASERPLVPEAGPRAVYADRPGDGERRRLIFVRSRVDGLLQVAWHGCWTAPSCREQVESLLAVPRAVPAVEVRATVAGPEPTEPLPAGITVPLAARLTGFAGGVRAPERLTSGGLVLRVETGQRGCVRSVRVLRSSVDPPRIAGRWILWTRQACLGAEAADLELDLEARLDPAPARHLERRSRTDLAPPLGPVRDLTLELEVRGVRSLPRGTWGALPPDQEAELARLEQHLHAYASGRPSAGVGGDDRYGLGAAVGRRLDSGGGLQGQLDLRVWTTREGLVERIRVARDTLGKGGDPGLTEAFLETVRSWTLGSSPAGREMKLTLRLSGDSSSLAGVLPAEGGFDQATPEGVRCP